MDLKFGFGEGMERGPAGSQRLYIYILIGFLIIKELITNTTCSNY